MRYDLPRMPQLGQPITADWGRDVVRCLQSLVPRASSNIHLSRNQYGTMVDYPTISTTFLTQGEFKPFDVRWLQKSEDGSEGEWQIYLPRSCAMLTQGEITEPYVPVNLRGQDSNGEELFEWYKISEPDDSDAVISSYRGYAIKEWTVYVHLKPWAKMGVNCQAEDKDDGPFPYNYAVAQICEISIDGKKIHVAKNKENDNIAIVRDISQPFSVRYTWGSGGELEIEIINGYIMVGRLMIALDECKTVGGGKSIKGEPDVWVRINHEESKYTLELDHDLTGADAESDDKKTVFKIYELKDAKDVVTNDLRDNLKQDFGFYTNDPQAEQ